VDGNKALIIITSNVLKAQSLLQEWNFEEAMILTNAIKYLPNIPHTTYDFIV
jgi:hypothetical protein